MALGGPGGGGALGGPGGGPGGSGGNYTFNVQMNLTQLNMQVNQFNTLINNMAINTQNTLNNINMGGAGAALGSAQQQASGLDRALGNIVGRAMLMTGLIKSVRELADSFNEANEAADKLGKGTSDWMKSLQDLQAMKGRPGAVEQDVVKGQLDLMRMGATKRQAHEMAETFGGEAAIMVENKTIPQTMYNKIQARLAEYSMAMGGDTEAVMRLGGQVARSMGAEATPEAVEQKTAEIFRRVGYGAGKSTALVEQVRKVIASNVLPGGAGNIKDAETAATLVMGASFGTQAGRVGTSVEQTAAGLFGGTRGTEKFFDWTKTQGVTPGMDVYQRLKTIIPKLRAESGLPQEEWEQGLREVAEGEEGGEVGEQGKKIQQIMLEHGLKNAAVRRGLTAMMVNMGTMEKIQAEADSPEEQRRKLDEGMAKYRGSMETQTARAAGGLEAAQLEQGQRYQVRNLLLTGARERLTTQGRLGPESIPAQTLQDMMTGRSLLGGVSTQQQMVYNEAVKSAVERYGTDFQFGQGPGDTRITQAEIMEGVRSGNLTDAFEEAENRRRRRNGVAGPRGPATVEDYRGEGTFSDVARDVEGPLYVQHGPEMAANAARAVGLGILVPLINRIARATEATAQGASGTLPPPANPPGIPK